MLTFITIKNGREFYLDDYINEHYKETDLIFIKLCDFSIKL